MSNESDKSIARLADALLVAEAAYQRAREYHERERTALSQRLLIEARNRLEFLEGCAFEISEEPQPASPPPRRHPEHADNACPECGGDVTVERWSALSRTAIPGDLEGQRITMVRAMPEWAVDHAMRGTAIVSRHSCRACGLELSINTGAVD